MELYDASRKEVAPGRPALLGHSCVAPVIYVMPSLDDGKVDLNCHLPTAPNVFTYFCTELDTHDLPMFFAQYRDDPEATLLAYFGWDAAESARAVMITSGRPKPTPPKITASPTEIYSQSDLL